MASHFPALEDFEDQVSSTEPITDAGLLSLREQETLGESFGTDFPELIDEPTSQFERSFPAIDDDAMAPGGMITGSSEPYMPGGSQVFGAPPAVTAEEEEEPDVIKEWRERQALRIQHQDEQSERKKRETIEKAQRAIDDFYENYNLKKEKVTEQTKKEAEEFLEARENPSYGGTTWERIAKLVDLSEKSARSGKSDKSRFRELLMSLKNDENAPGAKVAAV